MSKTPFVIKVVRPTYGAYLLRRNHVRVEGLDYLKHIEGPFLLFSNHANAYDALWISSALPVHIRWVAGAYLFKFKGIGPLLSTLIGSIAKQQGRSDLQTIRAIGKACRQGDAVGIFPEGTRTWDGEPVGFGIQTAKLVKIFKVPIIVVNLAGAYQTMPRWARKRRKGTVTLRILPPLLPEEFSSMSLAELSQYLQRTIGFSAAKWQRETGQRFIGKAPAEGLEQTLYQCPDCHGYGTLHTEGDRIFCTRCSMSMRLDDREDLHLLSGTNPFRTVAAWHDWERQELKQLLKAPPEQSCFPSDRGILLQTEHKHRLQVISREFDVHATRTSLVLGTESPIELPFSHIQSMAINAKNTVELFCDDKMYRIRLIRETSMLKYTEWHSLLQQQSYKKAALP